MTTPITAPVPRGRSRLPLVLGGCAVLALCALAACTASVGYWFITLRTTAAGQAPSAEVSLAEVESLPAGDTSGGGWVFSGEGGCSACHSLNPGVRIVGPSMSGVAARAGTRRPNYSAERYLYESIVSPNAYVVEGFPGGVMPANYGGRLSDQQLADLVAFLMTR